MQAAGTHLRALSAELRITSRKRGVRRVMVLRGRVRGRVQGSVLAQCVGCSQLQREKSRDVVYNLLAAERVVRTQKTVTA
jgi:hypothetical protein